MTKNQRVEIEQSLMSIEQNVDFLIRENTFQPSNAVIYAAIFVDVKAIREQLREIEKGKINKPSR